MQPHAPPPVTVSAPLDALFSDQLLLAEYIHRSANDFAVACAEVHIARREPSLEQARHRLETVVDRLYSLATIQRLLLPPRTATVNLASELGDLCHHHAQARFAEQGVFVQLRAHEIEIDAQRGWAMLMIVSELLTNAARHAFALPGGLVKVELMRGPGEVTCLVSDDGIGMNHDLSKPRAGTSIMAELAQSAGIAMRARPCPVGTLFEMRVPLALQG